MLILSRANDREVGGRYPWTHKSPIRGPRAPPACFLPILWGQVYKGKATLPSPLSISWRKDPINQSFHLSWSQIPFEPPWSLEPLKFLSLKEQTIRRGWRTNPEIHLVQDVFTHINWKGHSGKQHCSCSTIRNRTTIQSSHPMSAYLYKGKEAAIPKAYPNPSVQQHPHQLRHGSNPSIHQQDRWIKKMWYISTMKYYWPSKSLHATRKTLHFQGLALKHSISILFPSPT